jgi:hypothetical protein
MVPTTDAVSNCAAAGAASAINNTQAFRSARIRFLRWTKASEQV